AAIPHLARKDCWYDVLAAAVLASVRLLLIRRDFEGAETVLNEARRIAQTRGYQRLSRLVTFERLRTIVRMGDAEGARHFAEINDLGLATARNGELNDITRNLRGAMPATIWARILQLEGRADEALSLIEQIWAQTDNISNVPRIIRLTLLRARLLLSLERTADANTVLERLILGQPVERYRVAFFEDGATIPNFLTQRRQELGEDSILARKIGRILELTTAPPTNHARTIPASGHRSPLTRQEIRLLSHLDHGKSNKEIARAMRIRENTVKFHLRNIYDKLEVHTRTAAVFSARNAGML
ncbi:MAG: response regulator transcription factor, partial [Alphaproteobacteria bacterium]